MASTSKTKPSPPKPRLKVNDGVSVEHYKIHRANLLLMGQSGTGKTTFTETLKNPKFTNKFEVVTSSTREPSLHNLGFRVGFNHFTLSVIDTPGLSDTEDKSDQAIQSMVLNFVKSGVTSLNMILIPLPMGRRIDRRQMETINELITFLGREMASITYILGTHSEGRTEEEKKKWIGQLKESDLKMLVKYAKGKFVWSGVLNPQLSGLEAEKMVLELKRNQEEIIKKAVSTNPIQFMGGDGVVSEQVGRFQMFESASKHLLLLEILLPKMGALALSVSKNREKLASLEGESSMEDDQLCAKFANVSEAEMLRNCTAWQAIYVTKGGYLEIGGKISQAAREIEELHEKMTTNHCAGKSLLTHAKTITEDDDDDDDSDFDIEI